MRHQSSSKKQLDRSNCFDIFLCFLVVTLVFLLVLACFFIIISHPKPPIVRIKSVQVFHFNITSSSLLTACLKIQFSLKNPNKKTGFSVESTTAYLVYQRKYSFLSTNINSFSLEPSTTVEVNATFDATSMFVKNHVSNDMREELMNFEVVNFDVTVYSRAFFDSSSSWIWGSERMCINCRDLTVGFLSNKTSGTMSHRPRRCKVEFLFQS